MAWTSPRTWISGEVVTAALLNTHLRDNLLAIGDPTTTTSYTATWVAGAAPATYSEQIGRYLQTGKRVSGYASIGLTSAAGAGIWLVQMPVAAQTAGSRQIVGTCLFYNNTNFQTGVLVRSSTVSFAEVWANATTTAVSAALASGYAMYANWSYEST